jgi:hypothetical protein
MSLRPMQFCTAVLFGLFLIGASPASLCFAAPPQAPLNLTPEDDAKRTAAVDEEAMAASAWILADDALAYALAELNNLRDLIQAATNDGFPGPFPSLTDWENYVESLAAQHELIAQDFISGDGRVTAGDGEQSGSSERQVEYGLAWIYYASIRNFCNNILPAHNSVQDAIIDAYLDLEERWCIWVSEQDN